MRLKSLKLAGFKSFANATTFSFPRGITAIVGPNGCGKSNVIDAIRWVLGETSAKQLRGGAMSDVIFAGTQDKPAKSVASVELTFEHTQDEQTGIRHELNLYHELSIRRQVNREGRSDYFINGTRARRRDVVDVFLGTGLGARSYAVIEQGMIGRIVDSSPMQLREFIEEAAGVSRYQARREETQKKLALTRDNLARLQDMQSELTRQQKSLTRQAASAQRHHQLSKTLADITQQLAVAQLYQAKQSQQQQKTAHQQSAAKAEALQAQYEQLKAQQERLTTQINQEQWLKDDAQSAHYQQQLAYQQSEHQLNDITAKLATTEQQLISLAQQRAQSKVERETLTTAQAKQQRQLNELSSKLDELAAQRRAYQQKEQPMQHACSQAEQQLSQLQDHARTLEQQQAINSQAQKHHQLSQDKLSRRQQEWQTLWEQYQHTHQHSTDNIYAMDKTVDHLSVQLQNISRQQDSVMARLEALQPEARTLQQRISEQQRAISAQEKSHALLAGEYDALHNILHPKPTQTTHATLTNTDETQADQEAVRDEMNVDTLLPTSTLREQIKLSAQGKQHAPRLDEVLGLWLDSQVLISSQDSLELRQTLAGYVPNLLDFRYQQDNSHNNISAHSLWLPAKSDHSAHTDNNSDAFISKLPDELQDQVLPLAALIRQPTLAIWQQCYLYLEDEIASSKKALALTQIMTRLPPSAFLLTPQGELISATEVINFKQLAKQKHAPHQPFLTQRLQQQERLAQLEVLLDDSDQRIQTLQQTIKHTQRDYDALSVSLQESHAQNEQLTTTKHKYQQQLASEQAALQQRQADELRLNHDKTALATEQQELALEQKSLTKERAHIEADIQALSPQLNAAQDKRQQLRRARSELQRNRQLTDQAWQDMQLKRQKSEMQLDNSIQSLARVTDLYQQSLQREQDLIVSRDRYQQQLPKLQATLHTIKRERDEQHSILIEREAALTALKDQHHKQQQAQETLQDTWQAQQDKRAKLATALALSESKLEDAKDQLQKALDEYYKMLAKGHEAPPATMSVSSVLTDFITHARKVRPDKITELQREVSKAEQQLAKIGPVNLAAAAELAEVNERLAPLAQQVEDITASMQTLSAAIASIDETTKTLFMQTLDAVNSELSSLFAKVFGGGQASLTLNTDEQSIDNHAQGAAPPSEHWRAGLTLMAQPKGKRNSRLAVLSGGEKTLTALSLIFAIFKQHPAPFCVLDEVDAPLDDANVARFTSLITDLADDLQFIFISHNKLSMQIADELKGITMPSAGVSTLVSVSLDEAEKYIES